MMIIGHKLIAFKKLNFARNINDLKKEEDNLFYYDEKLIKAAQNLNFSLICNNIKEAIIANSINAKFIVCEKLIAKKFSKLAEFYVFDSKIACIIDNENEIENLYKLKVDVAIFKNSIQNL